MVVLAIVVVPPFANTRCSEPSNKDKAVLCKLLLVQLEGEDKAETIPLELLGAGFAAGKLSNRITHSPRSGEGRWKAGEGIDVLARDLRSRLPAIKRKSQGNLLLESDVSNKKIPVNGSGSGLWQGQSLDVDIGVRVGGVRKNSGSIGIDDGKRRLNGEESRGLREGES